MGNFFSSNNSSVNYYHYYLKNGDPNKDTMKRAYTEICKNYCDIWFRTDVDTVELKNLCDLRRKQIEQR